MKPAWLFLVIASSISGVRAGPNGGEQILRNVEEAFKDVGDYSVDLEVTSDIERMKVPQMKVRMYFKQPDRFHFESEQFAMLPREGLAFNVARVLTRFTVEEVEADTAGSGKGLKLLLRPKDERARSTRLVVHIDTVQWKPTRIVSSLFDGRSMTAMFKYERQGGFIMPSKLNVQFSGPDHEAAGQDSVADDLSRHSRPQMPRKGSIAVRYSNYSINTGLPDELFDRK